MPDRTPAQVAHALLDGVPPLVLSGPADDLDALVDAVASLYADRTSVTHPMAPFPGEPRRTRDDVRRHFATGPAAARGFERFEAVDRVVHPTADPEVVIAEFRYACRGPGGDVAVPCVFVLRVRDGEIVESRDYTDHVALARAAGRIDDLARGLTADAAA